MNKQLEKIINISDNIVLFTGAGISCGSGIPDFRSENGLYNSATGGRYRPEEIISHSFFEKHPDLFFDFYKSKMIFKNAKPNSAHKFFAELEKSGKLKAVVTQNIDGLHTLAGNKNVFELHGSIYTNYCVKCGKTFSLDYVLANNGVPKCDICDGIVRPDVVLYEEPLKDDVWMNAIKYITEADCMIIVGTSLSVYPAANLVSFFHGKNLVLINKQKTMYDENANLTINEDIEKVLNN